MGSFQIKPSVSHIPGERVSKEAQKAQKKEALQQVLTVGAAASLAGAGAAATAPFSGALAGAMIGGAIGSLVGKQLSLPNNKSYTIQPGDNLTSIAKAHLGPQASGNDVEKFMNKVIDLNEDIIDSPHQIYKGDTIALPVVPAQGQAKQIQNFVE
jgi:nucleoid-associated protein YgaU